MNPSLDALRQAHQELRAAVPVQRRNARREAGNLHGLGAATFAIWDRMKTNGESFEDRCAYMVGVLKQILNRGREWKKLCHQCWDDGLVMHDCPGDATCGRPRQHLPHTYGTPCVCSRGRQFEPRQTHADDYTAAGKTAKKPPKGWSMGGR